MNFPVCLFRFVSRLIITLPLAVHLGCVFNSGRVFMLSDRNPTKPDLVALKILMGKGSKKSGKPQQFLADSCCAPNKYVDDTNWNLIVFRERFHLLGVFLTQFRCRIFYLQHWKTKSIETSLKL